MFFKSTIASVTVLAALLSAGVGIAKQYPHAKPADSAPGTTGDDSGYVVQKRADGTIVKYKKKTAYDFEGANIDGLYNKPSGSYISNLKDVKAKSIIRIRENFDEEVSDSARMMN